MASTHEKIVAHHIHSNPTSSLARFTSYSSGGCQIHSVWKIGNRFESRGVRCDLVGVLHDAVFEQRNHNFEAVCGREGRCDLRELATHGEV